MRGENGVYHSLLLTHYNSSSSTISPSNNGLDFFSSAALAASFSCLSCFTLSIILNIINNALRIVVQVLTTLDKTCIRLDTFAFVSTQCIDEDRVIDGSYFYLLTVSFLSLSDDFTIIVLADEVRKACYFNTTDGENFTNIFSIALKYSSSCSLVLPYAAINCITTGLVCFLQHLS